MINQKLQTDGRFFSFRGERIVLSGVTLGPFPVGKSLIAELPEIAAKGCNMVRVYETPPRAFLDEAHRLGIHVFASVPWSWEVNYLEYRALYEKGYLDLLAFLTEHGDHPALSAIYIANETPSWLVHEMGKERVKDALEELINRLRPQFPNTLYAYANYPTTEFLELENTDFTAFNVYLESEEAYRAYLQHLQIVAGDRPLVISEFGADVGTHGEEGQAGMIEMATRISEEEGVQGMTIFAWSDVWFNNGSIVDGWLFGMKTAEGDIREASAYLGRDVLPKGPHPSALISVVVCSYNGAARIEACLESLLNLNDESYEVVVIDDGSSDGTSEVAQSFLSRFEEQGIEFRIITQENKGLSVARNRGAEIGGGELIAYTDDDARPDQDWLKWLRVGFQAGEEIGMVGGYGLQPTRDEPEAQEVSRLPGQASPVLLDNTNAEHLPGCNMAVRKKVWQEVSGFREKYRIAGDDVDFCWRVLEAGYGVKFHPCAIVWHESRATFYAYLKQQWGYGKAEALLYEDHPEKFGKNGIQWQGGVYKGDPRILTKNSAVYTGLNNDALFQPIIYGNQGLRAKSIIGKIMQHSYHVIRKAGRLLPI